MFSTHRRVEFSDTDSAGIAHFTTFLRFMEQAEHEFLRSINLSVFQPCDGGGTISWPRVRVECSFSEPARFEELLRIELRVARLGSKSVTYRFAFFSAQNKLIAQGESVAVCCHVRHLVENERSIQSIEIPADIRTILSSHGSGS